MYLRRNSHLIFSKTLTPGTDVSAQSCDDNLRGLEPRPNGRYAYAYAIAIKLVCTIAETGTTTTFTVAAILAFLKSLFLSYAGMTRMNNLSGVNLARIIQQSDEQVSPDMMGSTTFPGAAIAANSGATSTTVRYVVPLAPGMFKANDPDKFTGLIPLSALKKNGSLKFTVVAQALCIGTAQAGWNCSAIAATVYLKTVELDHPVEHVAMFEQFRDYADSTAVLEGDGDRLYSTILVTDDLVADLTMPTAFSFFVDGSQMWDNQGGAVMVNEENDKRLDGINDIMPAVLPVQTLTRHKLSDCLPCRGSAVLKGANDAHSGSYGVLVRYSKKLDKATQRQIQLDHGVPAELVARYADAMDARPTAEAYQEIGRATVALVP